MEKAYQKCDYLLYKVEYNHKRDQFKVNMLKNT